MRRMGMMRFCWKIRSITRSFDPTLSESQPNASQGPIVSDTTTRPAQQLPLRPDLALIAQWIPQGARVLDLGCGDGALLDYLSRERGCTGYGVEIDDARVLACVRRGVDVIQRDIEAGLGMFGAGAFDVVVLSMALQATHQTEKVLAEMSQVAAQGIVSIPNFGHWYHAWSILMGRMPVSREMPYQWYDTPNLHLATVRDFEEFLARLELSIVRRAFLANGQPIERLPGLRATQAIYSFRRG
jgi:methionine biosynthesis protein MetW